MLGIQLNNVSERDPARNKISATDMAMDEEYFLFGT